MTKTDKILSISSMLYPSLNSSLEGISSDIFFRGCSHHCNGCHNTELQTFQEPNTSVQDVITAIRDNDVHIVTLMGGEPTEVKKEVMIFFLNTLNQELPWIKINLYTGMELMELDTDILGYCSAVKTGWYDKDNLSPKGSFLASNNQKYYRKENKGNFVAVYP